MPAICSHDHRRGSRGRLNGRDAISDGRCGGLFVAEARITLGEYSPLAIKVSVVGYGRAEKQQVQLMVRTLTGFQGVIESDDASDALAVAICHATTCRQQASQTVTTSVGAGL